MPPCRQTYLIIGAQLCAYNVVRAHTHAPAPIYSSSARRRKLCIAHKIRPALAISAVGHPLCTRVAPLRPPAQRSIPTVMQATDTRGGRGRAHAHTRRGKQFSEPENLHSGAGKSGGRKGLETTTCAPLPAHCQKFWPPVPASAFTAAGGKKKNKKQNPANTLCLQKLISFRISSVLPPADDMTASTVCATILPHWIFRNAWEDSFLPLR